MVDFRLAIGETNDTSYNVHTIATAVSAQELNNTIVFSASKMWVPGSPGSPYHDNHANMFLTAFAGVANVKILESSAGM